MRKQKKHFDSYKKDSRTEDSPSYDWHKEQKRKKKKKKRKSRKEKLEARLSRHVRKNNPTFIRATHTLLNFFNRNQHKDEPRKPKTRRTYTPTRAQRPTKSHPRGDTNKNSRNNADTQPHTTTDGPGTHGDPRGNPKNQGGTGKSDRKLNLMTTLTSPGDES